jgi:hypothetical protein
MLLRCWFFVDSVLVVDIALLNITGLDCLLLVVWKDPNRAVYARDIGKLRISGPDQLLRFAGGDLHVDNLNDRTCT